VVLQSYVLRILRPPSIVGDNEKDSDKLNMSAIGAVKNESPIFKNQAGISSVAVGCNASSMLNTRHAVMWSETFRVFTVHLNRGAMHVHSPVSFAYSRKSECRACILFLSL